MCIRDRQRAVKKKNSLDSIKKLITDLTKESDEYVVSINKINVKLDSTNIGTLPTRQSLSKINNKRKNEKTLIRFESYESINLSWFSISTKYIKNSFKLLNEVVFSPEKLKNISSSGFEINIEYSKYNTLNKPTLFNSGISFRSVNNLSSLKQREIHETNIITQENTTKLTTNRTFNFFQGEYRNKISELYLFLHYYRYLDQKSRVAFHFFPRYTISEFDKPIFDLDIGLLISLKDKDKVKSFINAEVFYSLEDIAKTRSTSEKNLIDRGVIGLRFTLPFNIKI